MIVLIGKPGPLELALIFGVILLLVGPKKLPQLARSIRESVKEFKGADKENSQAIENKNNEV